MISSGDLISERPRLDGVFSHMFMEICFLPLVQGQLQDVAHFIILGDFYLLTEHFTLYINHLFILYINPLLDNKYSSYFPQLWYCDHRLETDLTGETRNEETADVCTEKPGLDGQCTLMEIHQQLGITRLNEEAG